MSARRAHYNSQAPMAGVTITDSYHHLLEEEERLMPERASAPVMRRLALPIVGLRMLGYSEVQLTGLYCAETLVTLLHQIDYSRRKLPGSDELEQGLARGALVTE